jgi:hypothetical protein
VSEGSSRGPDVTELQPCIGAVIYIKSDWPRKTEVSNGEITYPSAPYEVECRRSSCHAYLRSGKRDDRGNRLTGNDFTPHKMAP